MSPGQDADNRGGSEAPAPGDTRGWVARVFTWVEDVVYIGLSVMLAACAIGLLGHTANSFVREVLQGNLPVAIVALLDRLLLVLMIVELLYTVQVSFREHALVPEPFLIVGLVAATRRILVLTAEFPELQDKGESVVRVADDRAGSPDPDDPRARGVAQDAEASRPGSGSEEGLTTASRRAVVGRCPCPATRSLRRAKCPLVT